MFTRAKIQQFSDIRAKDADFFILRKNIRLSQYVIERAFTPHFLEGLPTLFPSPFKKCYEAS